MFLTMSSFQIYYFSKSLDLVSERKKLQTGSYVSVTFKPTTTFSMVAAPPPLILWGEGPEQKIKFRGELNLREGILGGL